MKLLALGLVAICVLALVACNGGRPTPDLDSTIEVAVRSTLEAEDALYVTVESRLAGTLAAVTPTPAPTATLVPKPRPLPTSTATPTPTATPQPTAAPIPTATPSPTATPRPPSTPWPTRTPLPTVSPEQSTAIMEYADRMAGGPGAIYMGDLNQLVGLAPGGLASDLGDSTGNVPLEPLERHIWIYESPYYQELLSKAKITNPTPLEYDGEIITIQHVCLDRTLLPCVLLETYFAPNLAERTNGKLKFITSSFPELRLAEPDTLSLITNGILDSATVYGGYLEGQLPPLGIQNLWGIYSSQEQRFKATQPIINDIEELVLAETSGVIMNHSWYAGSDQFFFCREKIDTLDGLAGKKTRSHSAALSDWINGMGAEPQFLAFADFYTTIERGILDCGATWADSGHRQRWYEVADYIIGPLFNFFFSNNVISAGKWSSIPDDLQKIIIEEAAKSELEAMRLASIQNEIGLLKNIEAGLQFVPFSYEIKYHSLNTAAVEHVVPAWVNRVNDTSHPIISDSFNNKIGPIVGLRIERDGSVVRVPITQGPMQAKP